MTETDAGTRSATYALTVLTFLNFLNYIDRWVVAAVVESIKRSELRLSDTQLGFVGAAFIIVYTVTAPLFGTLGDRRARPPLIALGVVIWSFATALAGFARGFVSLFAARSTVGVGEAAYGTIAPALLADHFPLEKRGRVLAMFYAAIPVGSAAGYIIGGLVDKHFGWRAAFWVAGAPGLLLALLVLKVTDPPRGVQEGAQSRKQKAESRNGEGSSLLSAFCSLLTPYRDLIGNVPFLLTAVGYGAYTFALGGLAFWMPAFLERARGMDRSQATVTFGAIALVTGFTGTFAGGWLGDFFLRRSPQSYLWVSGIATLIAAPMTYIALSNPRPAVYLTAIVIAEVLIFVCTGPVNSAILNVVQPAERATAIGLSVFVMHVLGDIPSPPLIGAISERTSLEHALILIIPVAILLSGIIWMYTAWRGSHSGSR